MNAFYHNSVAISLYHIYFSWPNTEYWISNYYQQVVLCATGDRLAGRVFWMERFMMKSFVYDLPHCTLLNPSEISRWMRFLITSYSVVTGSISFSPLKLMLLNIKNQQIRHVLSSPRTSTEMFSVFQT